MKRRRLFELNESARCPPAIRRAVTQLLRWGSATSSIHRAAVPLARDLLDAEGIEQVVDLGSGSGGPWPVLLREPGFERVRVTLTDRALDPSTLRAFPEECRSRVELGPPTEDLLPPVRLPGLRTAFACLHHLESDALEETLAVVAREGHPFLVEVTERTGRAIARQLLLFPAAFVGVLFIRPTLAQLALTYLVPVIPCALLWDDGVVSCLRSHHPEELLELARRHAPADYHWESGRARAPSSPAEIVYLVGRRRARSGEVER